MGILATILIESEFFVLARCSTGSAYHLLPQMHARNKPKARLRLYVGGNVEAKLDIAP